VSYRTALRGQLFSQGGELLATQVLRYLQGLCPAARVSDRRHGIVESGHLVRELRLQVVRHPEHESNSGHVYMSVMHGTYV
jgi:hypothetical protein